MASNDDSFNLDDMMEIFGEKLPQAESPAAAQTLKERPPVSAPASPKINENAITVEELQLLEEYEKAKTERKRKEQEAKRKKEEEEKRILEEYERQQREAEEREARQRREAEEKRKRELEALKAKQEQEAWLKEQERRIIEEYEKEKQARLEKERQAQAEREAKAQAELKALAEKQREEEERRLAEEKARAAKLEEELKQKAQAASALDDAKHRRLMELMSKVQKEISQPALPPLPGLGQGVPGLPDIPAAKPAPVQEPPVELPDTIGDGENVPLCLMFEEARRCTFGFLAPLIGIKASNSMLNKTLEKARAKAPAVLKDVNWKVDGSLREDGSLDADRLLKNVQGLVPTERVEPYLKALKEIVALRLSAVEAGLGARTKQELLEKVRDLRRKQFSDKYPAKLVALFYQEIVPGN